MLLHLPESATNLFVEFGGLRHGIILNFLEETIAFFILLKLHRLQNKEAGFYLMLQTSQQITMQQFRSTMKRSDCALESGKHLEWSQNLSNLPDLSTICHQSIEQIVTQLSVIGGWIVFQGRNEQQREWISYFYSQTAAFDPATLSYLKSEAWLSQELPASRLIPLHFYIPASPETLEHPLPTIVYIYLYIFSNLPSSSASSTELKFREYILL